MWYNNIFLLLYDGQTKIQGYSNITPLESLQQVITEYVIMVLEEPIAVEGALASEAVVRLMHLKEMYLYFLVAELTCLFGFDALFNINYYNYIAWSAPIWIRGIGYDSDNEGIRSWAAVLVVWFVGLLVLQVVILIYIMGIPINELIKSGST